MGLFKVIKRGDIILFILILLSSLITLTLFSGLFSPKDPEEREKTLVITKNGSEYMRCSLEKDREIDLGTNLIAVEGGSVYMKRADCKNQICVHSGRISAAGQMIVCLPNRITVKITGEEELDGITK